MNPIVDFFKGIVNWISTKMKKEGAGNTVIAVLLSIIIIAMVSGQADQIIYGVGKEMENSKIEQFEEHQDLWIESRELYGRVKTVLRGERDKTKADYILYIEYHNGSENIATGYQFCKFDVSMSVRSDSVPPVKLEDYRDENMWKWDVLLNEKLIHQKMSSFSIEEIQLIDSEICNKLYPNESIDYIVFYNIMYRNVCAGTLMFLYTSRDLVDYGTIATCGADVENTIGAAMMERHKSANERKSKK